MTFHYRLLTLVSSIIGLSIFIGCSDSEIKPIPAPDYSINSSFSLEIISTHENGWVKEARKFYLDSTLQLEFEYYANGHLKSCKKYSDYPDHHLFMEVKRNEQNQPVHSAYYDANGQLESVFNYVNGQLKTKEIHSLDGTTTFYYSNGQLIHASKIINGDSDKYSISYDHTSGQKTVEITSAAETIYSTTQAISTDELGLGILTTDHLELITLLAEESENITKVNQSFAKSMSWSATLDPTAFVPAPVLYHNWRNDFQPFHKVFAYHSNVYRSIIEQYPFFEDQIISSGFRNVADQYALQVSVTTREDVREEISADSAMFVLKYGNEYVSEIYTGSYMVVIGALRNLPSDQSLRSEIKDIAYAYALDLVNGGTSLTEEDQAKLGKVFFELKLFSSAPEHSGGVVIGEHSDYKEAESILNNDGYRVIQKKSWPYAFL